MLAGGLIGAVAVDRFGPFLAMGLAMYGGNTEPDLPRLAYPWLATAAALLLCGLGLLVEQRGRLVLGAVVAHVGAIGTVLVPFGQVWRLWTRT